MIIEKKSQYKFDTSLDCLEPGSVFKVRELGEYYMKTDTKRADLVVVVNIANGHEITLFPSAKVCQIHAKVVVE